MDEQRKNRRFNCLVPVEGQKDKWFDGSQTYDLSKGGMGFISQSEIPVHEQIPIEMELIEGGDPVFVIGKVRWIEQIPGSTQYRLGLTFEVVLRGSKTRLTKYFKSLEDD